MINRNSTTEDLSGAKITETKINPSLSFSSLNRHYNENNFYQYNYGLISDFTSFRSIASDYSLFTINPKVSFRLGSGRVEPAAELFDAHFMIDDLNQRGFDIAKDQESLFELGSLLAVQNQRRILDGRRLRVNQLETISGWIATKDRRLKDLDYIATTVTITDNWLYNFFNNRAIGLRKSIGIDLSYQYSDFAELNPYDHVSLSLYGEWFYTKPINQYFHRSWAAFAGLNHRVANVFTDNIAEPQQTIPFINLVYLHSYHPNSRTTLSLTGELNTSYVIREALSNNLNIVPRVGFNTSYFINFNTRIEANLNLVYRFTANDSYFVDPFIQNHEIYSNQSRIISDSSLRTLTFGNTIVRGFQMMGRVAFLHSFF